MDLFREKLLDKLGADWGRPTPELLQAQTTAEEAKAKHQARQAKGALETRMLEPMDDLTSLTDSYLEAKAVISLGRNPFPAALLSDMPDLTGIPMSKAGGSGVARPGAEGPDRPPTIPAASGSGATSSGAKGPDKPFATPVGLDTKDPEVQLSVLRWMMSKRVGEVRIFAGRVRRPGPVHVPDWARNLTKVNLEALEKGTHPRNHQVGGLPWARYSVEELNQQAKAGDRPNLGDLRSIFWAAPHHPDEDFHWARQILSWALPGLLGVFGHSYTLRQLWGVWESLPLLQGPRQRGPRNKAQNQTRLEGWETLKEDARCFLKEEGLPFPQTGPEWRLVYRAMGKVLAARAFLTDTPAEVMQLPVQDVADSKEQKGGMRRAHLGPGGEPPAVLRGVQGPHGPHWRPGALAEVKVNWRCNTKQWWVGAVPDSVPGGSES